VPKPARLRRRLHRGPAVYRAFVIDGMGGMLRYNANVCGAGGLKGVLVVFSAGAAPGFARPTRMTARARSR